MRLPLPSPAVLAALGLVLAIPTAEATGRTPDIGLPPAGGIGCTTDVQALALRLDPEPNKIHIQRAIEICVANFGRMGEARAYLEDVTYRERCTAVLTEIAPQAPSDRMREAINRCVADEGDLTRARRLLAER